MKLKNINFELVIFILFSFFLILKVIEITTWNKTGIFLINNYLLISVIILISSFSFLLNFFEKRDIIFFYPIVLFIFSGQYRFAISFLCLIYISKVFNIFLKYYNNNKFSLYISCILVFLIIIYPLIVNFNHPSLFFSSYWGSRRIGLGYIHPKEQALAFFFLFLILIEINKRFKLLKYIIAFILILITNSRSVTLTFLTFSSLSLFNILNFKNKIKIINLLKFCIIPIALLCLLLILYNFDFEFYDRLSSKRLNIFYLILNEELPKHFSTDNSYLLIARENILFLYLILPWFIFIILKFNIFNLLDLNEFRILLISLLVFSFFDLGFFSSTNLLSLICFSKYYQVETKN